MSNLQHTPPCANMRCQCFHEGYEYNCQINGFTFTLSSCKSYMPEQSIERATGKTIEEIIK